MLAPIREAPLVIVALYLYRFGDPDALGSPRALVIWECFGNLENFQVAVIETSLSKPHTSELNRGFSQCARIRSLRMYFNATMCHVGLYEYVKFSH